MDVAPKGMTRVGAMMCGACSLEAAYKHAFIAYAQKKRGGPSIPPSEEESKSCMENQAPGSPNFAILSFMSAFHGRTFGALNTTRTKAMHKVDFPALEWPAAEPPRYKHPLDKHSAYNKEQDRLSLADVRSKIS